MRNYTPWINVDLSDKVQKWIEMMKREEEGVAGFLKDHWYSLKCAAWICRKNRKLAHGYWYM